MTRRHIQPVLEALDALTRAAGPDEAARAALDAAVNTVGADAAQLTRMGDQGPAIWSWPAEFLDRRPTAVFETVNVMGAEPLATHTRTGSGRALRISDLWSPHEDRASPMHPELLQTLSVKHQVAFLVPTSADYVLCMTLQREGSDFTDEDCRTLDALRPCLQIAARRYPARRAAPAENTAGTRLGQLTFREADVLRLVATGLSDRQIARQLNIEAHTVSKHLQHIYRKTGTNNRTQAAARLDQLPAMPSTAGDAFAEHDLAADFP